MKKLITIICIALLSCNTAKQLERTVAKVEKYKKALGIKPCDCRIMDDERIEWIPQFSPVDPNMWQGDFSLPNPPIQFPLPYRYNPTQQQMPLFIIDSLIAGHNLLLKTVGDTFRIKIIYE